MPREFGTDPYGIIARGVPGGESTGRGIGGSGVPGGESTGRGIGGSGVSVGRVGNSIPSAAVPGQSMGTGLGGTLHIPLGRDTRGGQVRAKAKGGKVKKMAKGGSTASKRADGCATKGKTKGRFV